MADDVQDISDYRDAIEGMLLSGEELEATLPAGSNTAPTSWNPKAIALTSHRLIICTRELKRGSSDSWLFTSIPFGRIDEVSLDRRETFHRNRIETWSRVTICGGRRLSGGAVRFELDYDDPSVAREVHDRILAHMFAV